MGSIRFSQSIRRFLRHGETQLETNTGSQHTQTGGAAAATTILTSIEDWGTVDGGNLLKIPPAKELHVVDLRHRKYRFSGYQHEVIMLEVVNVEANTTLHVVAERDVEKPESKNSEGFRRLRAKDTLSILSQADHGREYDGLIVLFHARNWNPPPPLHHVIAMLYLIHSYRPRYQPLSDNCYFFAAVGVQCVLSYRDGTTYNIVDGRISWTALLKRGRFLLWKLVSRETVLDTALAIIPKFFDQYRAVANSISTREVAVNNIILPIVVKENDPLTSFVLDLTGTNLILGAVGAFTHSPHVPQYIKDYDKYKATGISNIYVVAINDALVMRAWKEKLAPEGTGVRFIADDRGELTSSLGLLFDASRLLGSPRSKCYVIFVENGSVQWVSIEAESDPADATVTASAAVLARIDGSSGGTSQVA